MDLMSLLISQMPRHMTDKANAIKLLLEAMKLKTSILSTETIIKKTKIACLMSAYTIEREIIDVTKMKRISKKVI